MADQPGSARFQALFESALKDYEKKTGITLSKHPLALQLQSCHSEDDITDLLQGRAKAFDIFQEKDRMLKAIEVTVSILTPLSMAASLADAVGLTSFPPVKAVQAVLGILLDVADGVISSFDVLADLLESIEHFVDRLNIYTQIAPTPALDKIVVKLLVELISTLALVTKKFGQRRLLKRVMNFFVVKDVNGARQRLDKLMQEESRNVEALTLGRVDGLEKKLVKEGKASTEGVRKVLDQTTSKVDESKRDKLLSDIKAWLSPPDPWKNYNIARKSRHGETGAWFLKGDTLSKWKESGPSSLLWIHGKPGAGKSVICSTVIEDIEKMSKSGGASLAIYYYDFREQQKKDLRGLLSSVLFQLCDQSNFYYNILSTFHSAHHHGAQTPSDDDLIQCLKDLLNLPGPVPVYLVIDGLDEFPSDSSLSSSREELLSLLEKLVEAKLKNLRICVTSRPEVDIKTILEPLAFRSVSLHNQRGQQEHIKKYIESSIGNDRRMKNWSPEYRQLVIDVLEERADGMFRWADCQLKYLANCNPAHIRHALDTLPATLDETYERTLREINEEKWEDARRLLLCVAVASRPLRVGELAEILAFDFEAGSIPRFCEDARLQNPIEAVLTTCSTLLSVVEDWRSQVVQFAHFSVKEYLTSARFAEKDDAISRRYRTSMTPAHTLVAQVCLGMLLHLDETVTRDSLANFPLAQYAAEHWLDHARFEGVSQNVIGGMKQLFDCRKHHLTVWLWIYDPTVPSFQRDKLAKVPLPPRGTPLHYAAFCGLHHVVETLAIENSQDVNSRSFDNESTPLHLASREGHGDVARILFEHGADTEARTKDGETPLHLASQLNHVELARFLLKHGANTETQTKDEEMLLHWASSRGHVELSRLLLEHSANVVAQTKDGETPLHLASQGNHAELAQLLLGHHADVAAQTKDGETPLHLASQQNHVELARLLLKHSADVAARTKDQETPLHLASDCGHLELARLLFEHGADVAAQTKDGVTPLHLASDWGHIALAQLLFEHGADVAAETKDGETPLHWASHRGHVELARLLLEHSANVAAWSKDGETPLHWTSDWGDVKLARLLLEYGADAAAKTKNGSTPLQRASYWGHVELIGVLDVASMQTQQPAPV